MLFLRFTIMFGFMVLLFVGGTAAAAFIITRLFGGSGQTAILVWVLGLSLTLALPVMAVTLAMRAFRRIASPLADIMAAADAVAEGDLEVRVSEGGVALSTGWRHRSIAWSTSCSERTGCERT